MQNKIVTQRYLMKMRFEVLAAMKALIVGTIR
jgi:hypothetical protein